MTDKTVIRRDNRLYEYCNNQSIKIYYPYTYGIIWNLCIYGVS